MSSRFFLLLLLTPWPQDVKKTDPDADLAKRAAIIDRIMGVQPIQPLPRPAPVLVPPPPRTVNFRQVTMKQITLEVREVDPQVDGDDAANRPAPGLNFGINLSDFALSSANFDVWVFDDNRNNEARIRRLQALLNDKIRSVEKTQELELELVRRLRLAGMGDIKHFFDRVAAARREFEAVRQDYNVAQRLLNQLDPLATEYQTGPFGPNSIFEKTTQKIRGEEKPSPPASK